MSNVCGCVVVVSVVGVHVGVLVCSWLLGTMNLCCRVVLWRVYCFVCPINIHLGHACNAERRPGRFRVQAIAPRETTTSHHAHCIVSPPLADLTTNNYKQ